MLHIKRKIGKGAIAAAASATVVLTGAGIAVASASGTAITTATTIRLQARGGTSTFVNVRHQSPPRSGTRSSWLSRSSARRTAASWPGTGS